MNKKFTKLIAAVALLVFMTPALVGWGQTRDSYSVTYNYSDLGSMLSGNYEDASSYWKVPATAGNSATIAIPITYQPDSDITITFNIATFGSGTNPSSSNTTITAVGTETGSNWSGSGVSTYPSSSSFVNGVMTITKPVSPTTLGGLIVTMGVNSGVKIFRLKSVKIEYTPSSTPTLSIDPTTAGPFTYVVGNGPSDEQLFTVTGTNLPSTDITVSVPTDCAFEITDATEYGNSVTIESGDIISVRLKASLALGDYDATLSITSTGADPINVALSGSVTNPPTYTVTYDGNGATSGTAPTDATAYTSGQTVTVLGPGTLAKTGNTFVLWNTKADGTGTDYDEDETFAITANTTLFAQWLLNSHTVTLPAADSYGTYTMDKSSPVNYGTTVTLTYTPASGYELYSATWSVNSTPIVGDSFVMPDENVTVTVALAERTSVTYDFHFDVIGSTGWTNSYAEHVVEYTEANVTFAAAGKQTGTITDIPVTKGNPVSIVMKSGMPNPTGVTFVCRQWSDKAQTITLHYSTDGGTNYASTGITSTNFTISCAALPANTNAVKITFNSQSNQVGIESATLNFSSDPVISVTPTTLSGFAYTVGGGPTDSQTFTVSGNNLTANITVALPSGSDFELSEDETDWTNSLTLTKDSDGAVASTTIYARMKNGLAEGSYSDNVSVTSGTLSETVALSGTVNPAPVTVTYNLATVVTPGKHYIIVSTNTSDEYFAMGGQNGDYRDPVAITVTSNSTTISSDAGVTEIAISGDATNGYTLHATDGYLVGGNKTLKNIGTASSTWTISFSENIATISTGDYAIKYNASSPRFNCYGSGQRDVYLYEKASDKSFEFYSNTTLASATIAADETYTVHSGATLNVTTSLSNAATSNAWEHLVIKDGAQLKTPNAVNGTIEKAITGYSSYSGSGVGGYYLLATPASMDACNNTGMWPTTGDNHEAIQADIDFYSFDQSADQEWQNFKHGNPSFAGPYLMQQGQGYLYANPNDVTLTLQTRGYESSTTPYQAHPFAATNEPIAVPMSYYDSKPLAGYNLLGNPFTCDAYINREYYRMNDAGDAVIAAASATTAIKPCEGIFVLAADGDDNSVTFSTTVPSGAAPANVVINLKESEMVRDRAIVSFGNERNMPRFQFNEAAAKLYIPQGEKELAKVSSEAQGEMPVNFKADKNGTYTLSIDIEADMDYLHLIDNMTGADVDLLANPSYTFDARTSDYASRFRLVFSANDENGASTGSATFAYFNGSEWVVNSNGNATLQVVDVMGRVLSSETVNGNHTMNLNLSTGVYMLRLVNGNDVKTQKIVVR